jgi:hypothetical protein
MAKRKDLLLKESTVSRMMGLAGIGALTNPFLRESYGQEEVDEIIDPAFKTGQEEEMEEGYELDEMYDEEEMEDSDSDMDDMGDEDDMDDMDDEDEEESDIPHDIRDFGDLDRDDYLEEAEEPCKKCGKLHEGSCGGGYMQENIHKSMKRLKRLLEQAEGDVPPPAPEGDVPPPESAPGGDDQMESKIKEFVKKLGELVQETLGVEVTVEEGEGEPEMPPPAPEGGEAAPPAPMAEAINRLVNKVARRVKARLMEAKGEKEKAIETKRKMSAKSKEQMKMKALKEKQAASKKKEMEMKKKKAAMAKKK